jgi:hypothetical protein
MTKPHSRPATEPAIARPAELTRPEFRDFVASLPTDPDLDRLADELRMAWAALHAERERATDLRRRQASLTASLPGATGTTRTGLLGELLVTGADLGTVPNALAAATRRHARARLGYLHRLKTLAEAEAGRLVAATNGPIADVDRASLHVFRVEGYSGSPRPDLADEARHVLRDALAEVAPARERYRQVKEVAAMATALVEMSYGPNIAGFCTLDQATRPWEVVAERAAEQAAEHARREIASPLEAAA